jgi:DNA-binding GntR family transcriptional regulator
MLENLAPSLTLDERVYGELRRAIVNSHLQPGQELVVTTVAEQLGVSRIPVMHACQRLAGEGFLVANPRKSFVVAPMTESPASPSASA